MANNHYKYNDGSFRDEKIKLIIPLLVKWAQESWDQQHTYQDVANEVGAFHRHIGPWLGLIWSHVIHPRFPYAPTLNALVSLKQGKWKGLPSDGLDYVFPEYSEMETVEERKEKVKEANIAAHKYNWKPVLKALGLNPIGSVSKKSLTKFELKNARHGHGKGGESTFHLKLKEYVLAHPELIGIHDRILFKETEHILYSQDKVDVFFVSKDDLYAVEVKSEISDEDDIIRGIFQSIKYKAILEAQETINKNTRAVHSILVIGKKLPPMATTIAKILDVDVIEEFNID